MGLLARANRENEISIEQFKKLRVTRFNKNNAIRTTSFLSHKTFPSKMHCEAADKLFIRQSEGEISDLEYEIPFVLCEKPKIKITLDFRYRENGQIIYEDCKGKMERDFRVKLCWLKEKFGIDVRLTGKKHTYSLTNPKVKPVITTIEGDIEL